MIENESFSEHLLRRQCPILLHEKSNSIWINEEEEIVTFPIWNLSGQLIGYQRYNWKGSKKRGIPESKYWTFMTKNQIGVFGLDTIDWSEPVFIVEGVWDAITIRQTGRNCIAVMTNNPKHLWSWLRTLPSLLIAVCEGDKAGRMLRCTGDRAIFLPEGLDSNELGTRVMDVILDKFVSSGYQTITIGV